MLSSFSSPIEIFSTSSDPHIFSIQKSKNPQSSISIQQSIPKMFSIPNPKIEKSSISIQQSIPKIFSIPNPKIEKSSISIQQSIPKQKMGLHSSPSRCANMSGKWSQKSSECRSTPGIAPTRAERGDEKRHHREANRLAAHPVTMVI